MIAKGCTCKNSFPIPYTKDEIATLFVTYQQSKETVIEKSITDCTFEDGMVSVYLSQEETLSFKDDVVIKIQLRVKLNNGAATKSKIVETYTDYVLKDDVI